MSKKKRAASRLMNFIVIISLGVCILLGVSSVTYALINQDDPDVIIQIDGNGKIIQSGSLLGKDIWYPGRSVDGIMRIHNNFKRMSTEEFGLNVDIVTGNDEISEALVYNSFINNMRLTISKGKLLAFDDIIVDNKSIAELLIDDSNKDTDDNKSKNFQQYIIEKGSSINLKYTLCMNRDAGEELQGINADVAFTIGVNEIPAPNPPDDDDDDDDRDDKDDDLIEEPDYIIPGLDGHWAHDCIIALIENDVIDPDSKSRIRPDDYITRAEAAVLMGRALKLEESDDTDTGYVDNVPTWARGYVIATTKAKVFKGYPGNIFKAYGNITREEMTAVLIRAFRENAESSIRLNFTDEADIADWAYGNVAKSVEDGIVVGYEDNTFRPKAYMTRAEAFTIVCRLLGYHEMHNKKI